MFLGFLVFIAFLVIVGLLPYEIHAAKTIYRPVAAFVVLVYLSWVEDLKKAWRS